VDPTDSIYDDSQSDEDIVSSNCDTEPKEVSNIAEQGHDNVKSAPDPGGAWRREERWTFGSHSWWEAID
jgi:hypothetical protein